MNRKTNLMKWIFPVLLLVMISAGFKGSDDQPVAEIKWYDWNEGVAKARAEGKIALIDTYTDWCHWCKVMDKNTYSNATIIDLVGKNFVAIKFNPELDKKYINGTDTLSGRQLLAALSNGSSSGYPTTFFYLTKKNIMYMEAGYIEPVKFESVLQSVIAEHAK
jgi:uncharacterized protein YyaL (SSP411 family)